MIPECLLGVQTVYYLCKRVQYHAGKKDVKRQLSGLSLKNSKWEGLRKMLLEKALSFIKMNYKNFTLLLVMVPAPDSYFYYTWW